MFCLCGQPFDLPLGKGQDNNGTSGPSGKDKEQQEKPSEMKEILSLLLAKLTPEQRDDLGTEACKKMQGLIQSPKKPPAAAATTALHEVRRLEKKQETLKDTVTDLEAKVTAAQEELITTAEELAKARSNFEAASVEAT
eukprot:5459695-Pyramimonas_sp.AAC.1